MSPEHAKELCRANGGTVVSSAANPSFVVVGARSPKSTFDHAKTMGKQVLSELQFLAIVLGESPQPTPASVQAGTKRPADTDASTSRPAKARKSDIGYPSAPNFPKVLGFLYGGEIRLEKKMLKAFDCGGGVFKATRGKNPVDLLQKFEDWLPEDGECHDKIMPFVP